MKLLDILALKAGDNLCWSKEDGTAYMIGIIEYVRDDGAIGITWQLDSRVSSGYLSPGKNLISQPADNNIFSSYPWLRRTEVISEKEKLKLVMKYS